MTISVIIPAFQGAHYLNNYSLPSLLRQDYQDWEAIIVDDASTDNTSEVIQAWQKKDARIKFQRHDNNRGLAAALNTGLKNSQGEVVAFLEQDDLWLANKLSRQVEILKTKKITDCRFFLFDQKNQKLTGLGGGNFSTLASQRQTLDQLFPLPEDKQYLGIEDGLLAGHLALLIDRQTLLNSDIFHDDEPLVIVSRHNKSLSGHGHCLVYAERYRAALNYFHSNTSPSLKPLKHSWKIRRQLNQLLSNFPEQIQKIIRQLVLIPGPGKLWRWQKIKKQPAYQAAEKILSTLK